MQVASRLVLMWGVTYPFPEVTVSPWYSSMLIAWSLTEVIRYTYFAIKESGIPIPYWLHWLRYSAFAVLYPVGISSELAEMFLSWNGPAAHRASWYPWAIGAVASTYIYG
jgi:very-long-chain (3R)-3-hydroxyacyl-CoA dehydratase